MPGTSVDKHKKIPIVLLHAFPFNKRLWRHQAQALARSYDVITPDFRGFGDDTTPGPFSIEDLADDVNCLADTLALPRFVLGGVSVGGYVAAAFAGKYPQRLAGLMMIDSKATPDTPDGRANRDKMITLAMEKGSAAIAEKMLPTLVAPAALEHNAPLIADLRQMITATPPATIMHALAAMRDRPDRSTDIAQLACPILVLAGEEDSIIPPEMARALASTLKHPTLRLIPNAGHLTLYEAPAAVTAAMEEFLEQIAP